MKQEEHNKKFRFREFVNSVRRFAKGENDYHLDSMICDVVLGRYGSSYYPDELNEDIKEIAMVILETNSVASLRDRAERVELSGYDPLIRKLEELEENRDYRAQKIKEFLQRHRYVRRVVPISERLEISDERLEELAKRIKPVVRYGGKLYYIKNVDLRKIAFTWSQEFKGEAKGLEELTRIRTYHTFSYPGFFKPSIAEVLAQIPKRHLPQTLAFEIPIDITDADPEFCGDYHKARTILYKKSEK